MVVNLNLRLSWVWSSSRDQTAQLKQFGANMRRERVRLQMTQEQLAEQGGLFPCRCEPRSSAGTGSARCPQREVALASSLW